MRLDGNYRKDLNEIDNFEENIKMEIKIVNITDTDGELILVSNFDIEDGGKAVICVLNSDEDSLYKRVIIQKSDGTEVWSSMLNEYNQSFEIANKNVENLYITQKILDFTDESLDITKGEYYAYIEGEEFNRKTLNFYDYRDGFNIKKDINNTNNQKEVIIVKERDKSKYIINKFLNMIPVSIDISNNISNDFPENSILIEKVGNLYITLFNLGSNLQCLLFNDSQFIEFEEGIGEYYRRVKSKICKQYMISGEKFDDLSKLIITDDEIEKQELFNDNVKIINRRQALSNIAKQGGVLLDLGYKALGLVYYDEDNLVNISLSSLGLAKGEEVLEEIKNIYDMFKEDKVTLTGFAVKDSIYAKITDCEEDDIYDFHSLAKSIVEA